ncbi:hypothetical protein [Bacillus atrophaeus]|uniref:Uncharacterized protein n=1 Tax=Bacillus atrophaeus (strain 1942) TaxID=720555 RepID=A0ABN3ZKG5_BACA1|nr:hypothetical protein [Bacillus atrophaeus]AMR64574.1 hypothetical protein A1D11_20245 [Bacillus subtilis subsp. globigii]ADP34536.1 hypothetical protein BATR1942_18095 [Bacillus atrophaeus 1942]AIK47792.1 hypothetical protein DJ95_3487 [Bacillus atrophaeus subsp. globigii]EIM11422.1 hypothetical protein UY9_06720 [Bacillus atrophaeus C89]KFK84115.1 hypothetical protein DK44_144 [Bacillus atrophaeus]
MIKVVGRHVVIEVRCTSIEKVTTQDFNESVDEVCNALKENAKDIKHFLDNFPYSHFNEGHRLTICKR